MIWVKRLFSIALSLLLVTGSLPLEAGGQQQPPPPPAGQPGYSGQGAPLSANELQQLVAPIALYPDALVAQVLGAATFPDQVAYANDWVQQNKNLTGQALMQAVDQQPWDPSVKALTQFPSVLDNMTKNLSWTSALGEAYHTQSADVMTAVQTLRAQAYAAGNLKTGSQITVVQQSPQTIVIQPANPQVVYVPEYNPAVVYGTPYTTPGYSTGAVVATGLLAFGAGIAVGAAISGGGCCGWGYSSWNCNWHGGAVVYGGGAYYGNNAWHGGYYGSSATAYGPYGTAHAANGYNPSTGTYARGGSVSTPYGSAAAGQAYNPRTGTYAQGASTSTAYGTQKTGQAYNANTGAYASTHQTSNAYGNSGSSTYSKNGQTVDTQHYSGAGGSYGAAESSNGNKYATANGNEYRNTGSGWQKNSDGSWNNVQKPSSTPSGWGQQEHSGSAFGGSGGGWQNREASARGSFSRGGGGGWRR